MIKISGDISSIVQKMHEDMLELKQFYVILTFFKKIMSANKLIDELKNRHVPHQIQVETQFLAGD